MSANVPVKNSARAKELERRIREAGERAKAEAEARQPASKAQALPPEKNGPSQPEPTRYGDWERGGLASDF